MTARDLALHRGLVPSGNDAVDARACRLLWRAVLAEMGLVALGKAGNRGKSFVTPAEQSEAQSWFGSRNFYTVCALAGFDGAYILRKYRARLGVEDDLRGAVRRGRGRTRKVAAKPEGEP